MLRSAASVDRDPFPISLLLDISRPEPQAGGWGLELLPFLRWLNGHLGWRHVGLVDDGRGFRAPVLPRAMAGTGIRCDVVPEREIGTLGPGCLDFVHVTAEYPPDSMQAAVTTLAGRVAEGGLVLLHQAGAAGLDLAGALHLPVGDGLVLWQPHGPANPVMAWLAGCGAAEISAIGSLFDRLGEGVASHARLEQMRIGTNSALSRANAEASLVQRVEQLRDTERHLREVIARLTAERDAPYASTSWRLTAPLRRAARLVQRLRVAGHVAGPGAPAHAVAGPDALQAFLASASRLALPDAERPALSVLLVVEDEAAALFACLRALLAGLPAGGVEVVVAANACQGDVARLLDRLDGARTVVLPTRLPLAEAFAAALHAARGDCLLLLDCRVRVRPGALQAAAEALRAMPGAGAVVGKLVDVAGAVIQAGEGVDAAGTLHAHGQGMPAAAPDVQYRRVTAAGSGLFLFVRGRLMRQLGGLNPAFAGTAHAGADLCLRLRQAGWQTVYEPAAEAVLDTGASLPDSATGALFALRHGRLVPSYSPCDAPAQPVRDQRRLLIIDDRVPYPALGAGYPRAARMMHELHRLGWRISFFPNYEAQDDWGAVYSQFPREVEFALGYGRERLAQFLHQRAGLYDTVLVSRPHNMRDYLSARMDTARPRRLVYDAEAVFATREFLRLEQAGSSVDLAQREAILREEMGLTATAEVVTAVNAAEAAIFRDAGCRQVEVLGHGPDIAAIGNGFAQRRDVLFVGALGEDNSPNADSVLWFVQEIMPLLDRRIGTGYRLLVAGRCRAPKVLALASARVQILGLVDDLAPLYGMARAFVAPTRYAAGLPLKVQEAAGRGLPVIGTALLARQLGWTAGIEMAVGSTAEAFAERCAEVYTSPPLWYALRRQALDRLVEEQRQNDFAAKMDAIFGQGWLEAAA